MTVFNSDMVSDSMNGLIRSGASVWPTKMFPEMDSVSAPEVRSVFCITTAIPRTIHCMTPR